VIELTPTDMAHGGEAVARLGGKAHFVAGAMPGERVIGEVTLDKGSWARVALTEVIEPSPHRVVPPCPHFEECGGCQWQFADYRSQLAWKRNVVAGQLAHLGRVEDPPVRPTVAPGSEYGYRNRMDFRITDGRPALHRYRSRELVPLDTCHLLTPELSELFSSLGALDGVRALTLRAAATTDDRLVLVEGTVPEGHDQWDASVVHRSREGLRVVTGTGYIIEQVAGVRFRVTGGSFFQNNTRGAEALVALVGEAMSLRGDESFLDAFAGGGLFAATVGAGAARVIAVEASPTALADLRHNLRRADVDDARVVRGRVEEVVADLDEYWDVAVVDPPRTGLGIGGVEAVTAAMPRVVAYVSCDPASLARDTRYLADVGYHLEWAAPVDLFPQTFHVETVARFVRSDDEA
jgi:23S rRNA (uracil1939-C5)-methyltransferase